MTAIEVTPKEMKALADKEAKKAKRKREKSGGDEAEEKRSKKRKEREALLSQVPETDEHGIAYSKLQRRRMMKRVKRGLPPVPTQEEEEERLKQEAQLKKEEEEELAGMMYHDNRAGSEDDDEDMENQEEEEDDSPAVDIHNADDDDAPEPVETRHDDKSYESDKKKRKRAKEVPADYVCQACKNKHEPIHWIYDCPDKVTVRGTNKVSKSTKGIHDPDEKKVFVSGLPFEAKRKDVDALFASCGKLVQCKLLTFPDTGRCKGQAYLTFDTAESAKKAVALNGTTIDAAVNEATKKGETGKARTELKLKVTKMLNRVATKKQSVR
jgi:hypothetical protein